MAKILRAIMNDISSRKGATESLNDEDWRKIATSILEQEKMLKSENCPAPKGVMVRWREDIYIGSIQEIAQESSHEIVLLSKSSHKLPNGLVDAIKRLDDRRLELVADWSMDLDGRLHVVRLLTNRLVPMTCEQTDYMAKNMPNICEI